MLSSKSIRISRRIVFLLIFISCSSSTTELATNSQRNWCYGKVQYLQSLIGTFKTLSDEERFLVFSYNDSFDLYEKDFGIDLNSSYSGFEDGLINNTDEYLKICKIWADMNSEI